jgi:hypothetical protein
MSISSLTSSTAASQLSYVSKSSSASSGDASGQVRNGPPPPRDGGGFMDAIASALQSIGVSNSDSGTSTTSTTSSTSDSSTDSSASSGNAAQALGSFLHELMGALHKQGATSSSSGDKPSYGAPPSGGPGRMEADLQSLISKLGSGSDSDTASTGSTASTDSEDSEDTTTSSLATSFQGLLQALGSDTSGASTKLTSFLQALSDKLPDAGASGNMINTSA